SGATFALIAQRSDPARVGSITGFVGAAGGLGGFVPPILLGAMWSATQDYSLGLLLLAGFPVIALLITLWIGANPPAPEAAAAGDTASRPRDPADSSGPTQTQTSDDDTETRSRPPRTWLSAAKGTRLRRPRCPGPTARAPTVRTWMRSSACGSSPPHGPWSPPTSATSAS